MDTKSKQQYMDKLREEYFKADKSDKGKILNEYCKNTGQERKYVIKKFRYKIKLKGRYKKRKEYYDNYVKSALVTMWKIFDYPCGQRFVTTLKEETDRMRKLGELICTDEVAMKLKKITSSTVDIKLEHEREIEMNKRKYRVTHNFPLKSEVKTKTSAELDRENPGVVQIDFVENCGTFASGDYVNSLSIVDIYSGWWEGDAVMGKGQERALKAIDLSRLRSPFNWKEMHPDNGGNIMNYHIYNYGIKNGIELSRSRPYKKNDNCFVEQKNSTHIRREVGFLRYDTETELKILSDLYQNELKLYKNFFQPIIKLVFKTRIKGKIKKRYDKAMTPYRRLIESNRVSQEQKQKMTELYESLNPAELRRIIGIKLNNLQKAYDKKKGKLTEDNSKLGVIIHHTKTGVLVS